MARHVFRIVLVLWLSAVLHISNHASNCCVGPISGEELAAISSKSALTDGAGAPTSSRVGCQKPQKKQLKTEFREQCISLIGRMQLTHLC
jgi:hypothetical protein